MVRHLIICDIYYLLSRISSDICLDTIAESKGGFLLSDCSLKMILACKTGALQFG